MAENNDNRIEKQIADRKDVIEADGGDKKHQERLKQEIANLEYEKESRKENE